MQQRFRLENVRIRPANLRDRNTLLGFVRDYYRYDHIQFNRKMIASGLAILLRNQSLGRAWLILNGRRTIGYLILTFGFDLEFGGPQATITDLFIRSAFRHKGVGRKVLMQIQEFCEAAGVGAIELQVTSTNAKALEFYQRCGFEAHERIPMSKRV
jgi:ribosomal protein S18 acetylase RimI-like enzyme